MHKFIISVGDVLETVVYADVLFLINFGMDLISLWLTFLIVHESCRALRLVLSAAAGGAFGVAVVVFDIGGAASFVLSVLVSALMLFVSCGRRLGIKRFIKYTFIFWGIGALLGGIITVVCSLGAGGATGFKTHNAPFFVLALGATIASLVVKALSSSSGAKECDAVISMFGVDKEVRMLVDSGNLAAEPISSSPLVLLKKGLFCEENPGDVEILCGPCDKAAALSPDIKRRVRVVELESASGNRTALCVFPDSLIIKRGRNVKKVRCVVSFCDVDSFEGYDGVIPSSLLK